MINPFSVVLIILIGFSILKARRPQELLFNMIILTASIELFVEVGYFIELGNSEITYRRAIELTLFFVSIYVLVNRPIKKRKFYKYGFYLLTIAIVSLLFLVIFPSNAKVANIENSWEDILLQQKSIAKPAMSFFVVQQNFQLVIYVITLFAVYSSFQKEDYFRLIKLVTKIIKFFFILGFFELILKDVLRFENYGKIVEYFFGFSEATIYEARTRGFGKELTGLTKEASHYSYMLFICITILFSQYAITKSKRYYKWIIIGMILILFCMSFSSVLFIIALIAIYKLYKWNSVQSIKGRVKKLLFITALIAFVIIIVFSFNLNSLSSSSDDFFSRRISSLLEEKDVIFNGSWQTDNTALEWSNRVRLLSIFMTLKAFIARPIFGYGFGTITCHGATAMMLAGTGIFGIYFWAKFNFYVSSIITPNLNKKYFNYAIVIFLFVNLFNSFALRPFHELHSFFFAISISLLFDSTNKNEYNHNYSVV